MLPGRGCLACRERGVLFLFAGRLFYVLKNEFIVCNNSGLGMDLRFMAFRYWPRIRIMGRRFDARLVLSLSSLDTLRPSLAERTFEKESSC